MSADKMPRLPMPALGFVAVDFSTGRWAESSPAVGQAAFEADQMHAYARAYAAEQSRGLVEALEVIADSTTLINTLTFARTAIQRYQTIARAAIAKATGSDE